MPCKPTTEKSTISQCVATTDWSDSWSKKRSKGKKGRPSVPRQSMVYQNYWPTRVSFYVCRLRIWARRVTTSKPATSVEADLLNFIEPRQIRSVDSISFLRLEMSIAVLGEKLDFHRTNVGPFGERNELALESSNCVVRFGEKRL